MLANRIYSEIGLKENNFFKQKGVIDSIIQFISDFLPSFIININQLDTKNIEKSYNNQLSMYFNAKRTNEAYLFQHDLHRTNSREPDIGVPLQAQILQGNYESIFDIECKRLNSNIPHVKQYVSGNTGGIERFKKNLHGTDLPNSAIIGYMENKSLDYWFSQINSWIEEQNKLNNCFWGENEYLKIAKGSYFHSIRNRISCKMSNVIELFHFFHNGN
jgi:hypothetical protein